MVNMMMDRVGMSMPTMQPTGLSGMTAPGTMSSGTNMLMVPRCTFKMEKVNGGLKITCTCDDKTAANMMQNLCKMLSGGLCSCCLMMNGMALCTVNLTMGLCKCEMTDTGVCLTCTSGDKACCEMIQCCCDCMNSMLKAGCTCCVMMNGTPVSCGTC